MRQTLTLFKIVLSIFKISFWSFPSLVDWLTSTSSKASSVVFSIDLLFKPFVFSNIYIIYITVKICNSQLIFIFCNKYLCKPG